jgi:hypothetical protein
MVSSITKESEESPMAHEIKAGTILIKDSALLPKELKFESEPCVPGWSLVKDFDGYALDREIRKTGWTFFCLAGGIKATTVFGIDRQKMVRRAIEHILASPKSEKFDSLEITRVASAGSERFPLVCYVTVSAQSRHIQESFSLCHVKDFPKAERKSEPSNQSRRIGDDTPLLQEPTKQSSVVSISTQ